MLCLSEVCLHSWEDAYDRAGVMVMVDVDLLALVWREWKQERILTYCKSAAQSVLACTDRDLSARMQLSAAHVRLSTKTFAEASPARMKMAVKDFILQKIL